MMKSGIFKLVIAFLICNVFLAEAQSIDHQRAVKVKQYAQNVHAPLTSAELAMVKEVYGTSTESFVLNRPEKLKSIKDILRNRVDIVQISQVKKLNDLKPLSEVGLFDAFVSDLTYDSGFNKSTFNPLKYKFNLYSNATAMYRVDNTSYVIIIKSQHQR